MTNPNFPLEDWEKIWRAIAGPGLQDAPFNALTIVMFIPEYDEASDATITFLAEQGFDPEDEGVQEVQSAMMVGYILAKRQEKT